MTKINKVKKWLLSGKGLTVAQSVKMFGYYRLSSGICRLKNKGNGLPIKTLMLDGNDNTRYAMYYIDKKSLNKS